MTISSYQNSHVCAFMWHCIYELFFSIFISLKIWFFGRGYKYHDHMILGSALLLGTVVRWKHCKKKKTQPRWFTMRMLRGDISTFTCLWCLLSRVHQECDKNDWHGEWQGDMHPNQRTNISTSTTVTMDFKSYIVSWMICCYTSVHLGSIVCLVYACGQDFKHPRVLLSVS